MIYETTDIKLSAVILSEIPCARLMGTDSDRLINSKKVLRIEYPAEYEEGFNDLVKNYAHKVQLVNVYNYNKNLNLIRNMLFEDKRSRGREIESGKPQPY